MKRTVTAVLVGLGMLAISASHAAAVQMTGGFAIAGPFQWTNNAGVMVPLPSTATSIDFNKDGATTNTGTFNFITGNGDFTAASLGATSGVIKDFSFTGPGSVAFPLPPILIFELIGGLTFDLTSITMFSANDAAPSLTIVGAGVFHKVGFDDTPGVFNFSGQFIPGAGEATFSFSASNAAVPTVPEPGTLILLGSGLLCTGLAWKLGWTKKAAVTAA